jgi:hypothetical protein
MDKGTQTGRTPAPITVHAKRIFEIAKLLNPVYEQVDTAFQNLFGPDMDGEKLMREWAEACYQYNRVAGGFLREIAILTGNNPETLEQVFRPRDAYSTFPTPTFIANVARYESFNDKLWTKYSGMEREPTNDFGPL